VVLRDRPVGTVFRRLRTLKHARKRDIRAPVENESEYALGIVANQQNHRFGEMRIAEVSARHQQLSGTQTFGILGLDWKKIGWQHFAFRPEAGSKRQIVPPSTRLRYIKLLAVPVEPSGRSAGKNCGQHRVEA